MKSTLFWIFFRSLVGILCLILGITTGITIYYVCAVVNIALAGVWQLLYEQQKKKA